MRSKVTLLTVVSVLAVVLTMFSAAAPASAATCTATLGFSCGPYYDPTDFPPSNGYTTYVPNQNVGAFSDTTSTLTTSGPSSWSLTANTPQADGRVQIFPDTQQLFNTWCSTGWDNGQPGSPSCPSPTDTPIGSLSALKVNYTESGPSDSNSNFQFSPDLWVNNYPNDTMFWVDTTPTRCTNNGLNSSNILGQASLGNQNWTVYRYGGAGGEIVFILDGTSSTDPVTTGTCARQTSGTIDVKAGIQWLENHGYFTGTTLISQLNTGYEITSADGTTFNVSNLTYTATVGGGGGQQAPAVTTNAATNVTGSGATLNGTVNPEGASTTYQFDYGTTASYGSSVPVPAGSAGAGSSAVNESATLSGLQPSTTYHYRIKATNSAGTSFGSDQTFTTASSAGVVVESADFEADTENHIAWFSSSVTRSTLNPISGAASLRVATTAEFGSGVELSIWPGYGGIQAGQAYDVSLRYRTSSDMPAVNWNVLWSNANGDMLRTDVVTMPTSTANASVSRRLTAPTGATHIRWTFTWRVDGTARPIFRVDDLMINSA